VAARRGLNLVGAAGAGLVTSLAAWTALNRAVVRRLNSSSDPIDPADLDLPEDVREHTITMSDGWVVRSLERGPKEGPPVLLLHGITLGAAVWPYQLGALADAGLRVVALDLRGHGQSGRRAAEDGRRSGSAAPTLDRLATDVSEVLDAMELDGVVLVGHSLGGMAALRLLGNEPGLAAGSGRLAGLVLAATTANATHRRGPPGLSDAVVLARPLVSSASGLAARLPGPTLPAHDLAFLLARVTFGERPSSRHVAFTGRLTSDVPVRVSASLLLDVLRFNAEDILDRISVPTGVVVGEKDLVTPPPQSEYLATHIASSELQVLAGCGHMLMLERPDELNRIICRIVERAAG